MDDTFSRLRRQAEEVVKIEDIDVSALSELDIKNLIHNLEVHRMELEMQNDELQHANKALAETKQKYVNLFEFAPVGYITLDQQYQITEANLTFTQLLGLAREDILEHALTDVIEPDFQDAFHLAMARLKKTHEKQRLDLQLLPTTQTFLWARIEILARNGGTSYFVSVNDITAQKHAEQTLKASEAKFKGLFDVVVDPMFIHDLEGHFLEVNESACRALEYSREELLKMGASDIDAHFSRERVAQTITELLRMGEMLFEGMHITRNRREFPVEIHSRIIEFEGQQAILSLARDISRRKEAEQRYELLSNVTFEGILVHKGAIAIDMNASCCRLTGYSREELLGRNMAELIATEEDRARALQNMKKHEAAPYVVKVRRKDGTVFDAELEARNIDYQGKEVRIVAIRDVTEKHQMQTALQERIKELRGLYAISTIIEDSQQSLDAILPQIVAVIPPAWQYPEHCYAKIEWQDHEFATPNYADTRWRLQSDIHAAGQKIGTLIVGYVTLPADTPEHSVFFPEEEELIRAMAERIGNVIERRQAEQALRESQEQNQRLADATFEAVFFSEHGNCTNQNRTAERLFGYTLDEAIGRPAKNWLHPDYRELVKEKMKMGTAEPYEAVALRKDGSTFPCEIQAKTAFHGDKKVRITALRDITDRKEAQQALQESEEKFRSIVENVNDIIYAITPEGVFTYVSPNWTEILGHDVDDVLGRNFAQFVHPVDVPLCADFLRKVLQSGKKQSGVEYRVKHKNGRWRWHFSNGSPLKDDENRVVSYIGVARDVTERKEHETMLKHRLLYEKSLAQLSTTLLQDTPDAIERALGYILPCSEASRIYIFENFIDAAGKLCMKQTHEVCAEGVTPEIDNPVLQHIVYAEDGFSRWQHALAQNTIIHGQVKDFPTSERAILEPQGILSILIIPLWVHQRWFGYIGFDDVQRQREWDAEDVRLLWTAAQMIGSFIERQRTEATIREALTEKEILLKEIHHRVKNNMQTIASLLYKQQQYVDDGHTRSILSDSIQRVKSMALIHEQIYRSQNLAKINLAAYIRELANKLFQAYKPKGRTVTLEIDVQELYFPIDRSIPLALILNELLTNSLKYAFPEQDSGTIWISCTHVEDLVMLRVGDNGVGLPDNFDIQQTSSLGLYLVYNLATKQLGGTVKIDTQGHTEFLITFHA